VLTRFDFEREFTHPQCGLKPWCRHVLHVLAMRIDKEVFHIPAQYQPSINDLARDMGCDRRTVMRRLNQVEAAGWVIRKRPDPHDARTKHARTSYFLRLPPGYVPARDSTAEKLRAASLQAGGSMPSGLGAADPEARGIVPRKSSESSSSSDLDVIITEIEKRTGRMVGRAAAALVRSELLAKASEPVRNAQAYLRSSIQREPDPGRWLPTPTPPHFRDLFPAPDGGPAKKEDILCGESSVTA
jgi:hypothetical protein